MNQNKDNHVEGIIENLSRMSRTFLAIIAAAFIFIIVILYNVNFLFQITSNIRPVMEARYLAEENIFASHLCLERILEGDTTVTIETVWACLDTAQMLSGTAMNGGQIKGLDLEPIDNPEMNEQIIKLHGLIAQVRELSTPRLRDLAGTASGEEIDHRLEDIYAEILLLESEADELLNDIISKRLARFKKIWASMLLVAAAALIIAIITYVRVRKNTKRALEEISASVRRVEESENLLFTTMHSMGDALITTDGQGKVNYLNPEAERMTGWEMREAVGLPIEDVFNIISEETGEPAVIPVETVLREKTVVGLANHTALISRDGTVRPIADSAAPILDKKGKLYGVVLVFQDVSDKKAAEDAVRASEEKFSNIVRNCPEGIYFFELMPDDRLILRDYNPAAEKLIPVDNKAMIGKTVEEAFPSSVGTERPDRYRRAARTGEFWSGDLLNYDDGKIKGAFAVSAFQTAPDQMALLFSDITERKRHEEDLKEAKDRAQRYLDVAGVMLVAIDSEGDITMMNRKGAEILEASVEEILGKNWFDIFQPTVNTEEVKAVFDKLVSGEIEPVEYYESWITTGGGKKKLMAWHNSIVRDEEGNIAVILSSGSDVTEERAAEEEMRQLRNLLSNIINSMPSVLVGIDKKGLVTQWNTQAERALGITAEQAIGNSMQELLAVYELDFKHVFNAVQERRPYRKSKLVLGEGEDTTVSDVTVFPLVANGIEGAVIRIDDVTERTRLEEMMIQSEKMLSVGGLAAGMAHEINNPLAGILQNVQVMRNRISTDLPRNHKVAEECGTKIENIQCYMERRGFPEMIESVMEAGMRAVKIVENMLSFSRKSESRFAPVNLAEALDSTVQLAKNDYDLKKQYDFRSIEIVREYQTDLPQVPCDRTKIQQVFLNVLRNGAQAMAGEDMQEEPRFTLRISEQDLIARVEIEDNGPGMDELTCKRVFEPFFTTKGVDLGTGLGLSVSYFIITENHGGKMSLESSPGEGAKFIIELPLTKVQS